MPSLRQIAARHPPVLLLDAASSRVQVGVVQADGRAVWRTSDEEAGIGLYRCLEQLDVRPEAVGAIAFCDGPGSILGIRTVAMTLRTWGVLAVRPLYSYCSLAIVAHALGRPGVSVIADARRDSWHRYRIGESLCRVPAADLAGELVMPEHFRHWSPLPPAVTLAPYSLAEQLPLVLDAELFDPAEEPDAFLHAEPSYVTWTPQIHRAPVPPP